MGNLVGENKSLPAWGPQGGEEEPEGSSWTTTPGHQGFSLGDEVFTCHCVNGVTLKSLSSNDSVSPEWGGMDRVYIFFLGSLEMAGVVSSLTFVQATFVGCLCFRWAFLVAQRLKHLPPMWETWV